MTRLAVLLLVCCATLQGCALRPLYSGGSSGPVANGLSAIAVSPIPERNGWLIRNALVDRLAASGEQAKLYRLEATLDDDITGFGIRIGSPA